MFEPLFDCPSIGDILLEDSKTGFQKGFLQNLPSVICGHALNPQQEHLVLGIIFIYLYNYFNDILFINHKFMNFV